MIGEPAPTQADLHFRAFGVPVRVHPWFWIIALLLGLGGGGRADPMETVIWVAVVFVSILIHELGHAFTQRFYGGHPRITLYSFGGLAYCDDCDRSPLSQILISLAGPAAGFLFAAVLILVLRGTGHLNGFRRSLNPVDWTPYDLNYLMLNGKSSPRDTLISMLLYVNIFWGLVNLLPIYPLDGGRIAREVFTLDNPRRGIIQSLWLSVIAAAALAAWALTRDSIYMAVMFGYLSYASYQTLQAYQGRRM
jgi:stage IV sporulation protein FB